MHRNIIRICSVKVWDLISCKTLWFKSFRSNKEKIAVFKKKKEKVQLSSVCNRSLLKLTSY